MIDEISKKKAMVHHMVKYECHSSAITTLENNSELFEITGECCVLDKIFEYVKWQFNFGYFYNYHLIIETLISSNVKSLKFEIQYKQKKEKEVENEIITIAIGDYHEQNRRNKTYLW